jgi:hypothetical protein
MPMASKSPRASASSSSLFAIGVLIDCGPDLRRRGFDLGLRYYTLLLKILRWVMDAIFCKKTAWGQKMEMAAENENRLKWRHRLANKIHGIQTHL